MTDLIIVAILVVVCGAAARYIYKAKKSGAKCIGCAAGENGCGGCSCGSSKDSAVSETGSCCGCHSNTKA